MPVNPPFRYPDVFPMYCSKVFWSALTGGVSCESRSVTAALYSGNELRILSSETPAR